MRTAFEHIRVHDCMHQGILSCAPDAPLGEIAGMMAKHHVHAVAITNGTTQRLLGVISDLDLVAAAVGDEEPSALQVAATEPLTVSSSASMLQAAQLMAEHGVSHLVVLDRASGYPVGVLSTLDVAAVYAGDSAGAITR